MSGTLERFTPLHTAIQRLKHVAAEAARQHCQHGSSSEQEATVLGMCVTEAVRAAVIAAELEGNAGADPTARGIAALVVAENALLEACKLLMPLGAAAGHVHSAAALLELALEEISVDEVVRG